MVGVQATPLERTERHRSTPTMQRAARSLFSCCPRVLAAWASTCTLQTLSSCMTVTGTPRWICRCTPLHCLLAVYPYILCVHGSYVPTFLCSQRLCPFILVFTEFMSLHACAHGFCLPACCCKGLLHTSCCWLYSYSAPSCAVFTSLQITVTDEHMTV